MAGVSVVCVGWERRRQKIWISTIRVKSDKSNVFLLSILFVSLRFFVARFFFGGFEMSWLTDCIISIIHKIRPHNVKSQILTINQWIWCCCCCCCGSLRFLNNDSVDCLFCVLFVGLLLLLLLCQKRLTFVSIKRCVYLLLVSYFFSACDPTKNCQSINLNVYSFAALLTRLTNIKMAVFSSLGHIVCVYVCGKWEVKLLRLKCKFDVIKNCYLFYVCFSFGAAVFFFVPVDLVLKNFAK